MNYQIYVRWSANSTWTPRSKANTAAKAWEAADKEKQQWLETGTPGTPEYAVYYQPTGEAVDRKGNVITA